MESHLADGKKETALTSFAPEGKKTILYDVKVTTTWNHVSQAFGNFPVILLRSQFVGMKLEAVIPCYCLWKHKCRANKLRWFFLRWLQRWLLLFPSAALPALRCAGGMVSVVSKHITNEPSSPGLLEEWEKLELFLKLISVATMKDILSLCTIFFLATEINF